MPNRKPTAIAAADGERRRAQPACSSVASTTPASARSDPTERSMPPEMMTNVIPSAITALIEVCSRTLRDSRR